MSALPRGRLCLWSSAAQTDGVRCALLHPGGRGIRERARVYFAQAGESLRLISAWRIASAARTLPLASGEKKEVVVRSLASRRTRHPRARSGLFCAGWGVVATHIGLEDCRGCAHTAPRIRRKERGCSALSCIQADDASKSALGSILRRLGSRCDSYRLGGLHRLRAHCPSHPEKRRRLSCSALSCIIGGRGIRERARVYFAQAVVRSLASRRTRHPRARSGAQAEESLRLMSAWRIASAARTPPRSRRKEGGCNFRTTSR